MIIFSTCIQTYYIGDKKRFAKYTAVDFPTWNAYVILKRIIQSKINVWSLYYRTEIVWFSIGFIIGANNMKLKDIEKDRDTI